jgi:hypothetical protein
MWSTTRLISCPNNINNTCTVASSLVNEKVAVHVSNCNLCDGTKNIYSCGLALHHLVQLKKFKPKKYPELHSIMFPGRKLYGPGNNLTMLLKPFKILFRINSKCDCENIALIMNNMGRQWCFDHVDLLISKLKSNAEKLKIPFNSVVATVLLLIAIYTSKNSYDY